ncbi:hypothetical protein PHJA_001999500 [Phtheirospermum japonicum]|uniref:Uncharacterized protein n=1 Tax=Phtheirospermum japonicum TaxID=374723 RepID=A0A830CH29_9LAMI|nr:hypothetical protein PHJA_001999500 [Phtheirospermum japonicum]
MPAYFETARPLDHVLPNTPTPPNPLRARSAQPVLAHGVDHADMLSRLYCSTYPALLVSFALCSAHDSHTHTLPDLHAHAALGLLALCNAAHVHNFVLIRKSLVPSYASHSADSMSCSHRSTTPSNLAWLA